MAAEDKNYNKNIAGKVKLEPGTIYCVPMPGGHLDVRVAQDDADYPGIDIGFISDNEDAEALSSPACLLRRYKCGKTVLP